MFVCHAIVLTEGNTPRPFYGRTEWLLDYELVLSLEQYQLGYGDGHLKIPTSLDGLS
jgi:hypothetical protein